MVIYVVAVIPLLLMVVEIMSTFRDSSVKVVTYVTDNVTATESFKDLKHCWDSLCKLV